MKVLLINGSPRREGNTYLALKEAEHTLNVENIETELIQLGGECVRGCIDCRVCKTKGKCVFDDIVNATAEKFRECDGIIVGSPVYYASANATLIAFLTRLFFSTPFSKSMKVGAAVVSARRSGATATFDEINKFFTISGMPVVSGQYWNNVHGLKAGEALQDIEGLQSMRTLGKNMAFLIKCIALGKEQYGIPEREPYTPTNFIH